MCTMALQPTSCGDCQAAAGTPGTPSSGRFARLLLGDLGEDLRLALTLVAGLLAGEPSRTEVFPVALSSSWDLFVRSFWEELIIETERGLLAGDI